MSTDKQIKERRFAKLRKESLHIEFHGKIMTSTTNYQRVN